MKGVEEVATLKGHLGWRDYLKPFIEENIKSILRELERGDFEDLTELKVAQARLRALRDVIGYVEKRVGQHNQNLKGGK